MTDRAAAHLAAARKTADPTSALVSQVLAAMIAHLIDRDGIDGLDPQGRPCRRRPRFEGEV